MELIPKDSVKTQLNEVVDSFLDDFSSRSFSGRHPELGKMVNCAVCFRRHRSNIVCKQTFIIELKPPEGLTNLTRFQQVGRQPFKGKRINPHYSKKRLQLVQRTIELYPLHEGLYASTETERVEVVTMHMARREAREDLEKERNDRRAKLQIVQHRSRRVNKGLLAGNSKVGR